MGYMFNGFGFKVVQPLYAKAHRIRYPDGVWYNPPKAAYVQAGTQTVIVLATPRISARVVVALLPDKHAQKGAPAEGFPDIRDVA